MNLNQRIELQAGGPGSGRHAGGSKQEPLTDKKQWGGHSKQEVLKVEEQRKHDSQMTQKQYVKSKIGMEYKDFLGRRTRVGDNPSDARVSRYGHEAAVKWALSHGVDVPGKVLKDYPDLKKAIK